MKTKTKRFEVMHLLLFVSAALLIFFIIFNATKIESLQGFLKFFRGTDQIQVLPSEAEFIVNDCNNLNNYSEDKYNNYSITYGVLAKLLVDNFQLNPGKNLVTCDDYSEWMENNGFITWRTGHYTNNVVSRMEVVTAINNVYESISEEKISLDQRIQFQDLPSWSEWAEWNEWNEQTYNSVTEWNDWSEWSEWTEWNEWGGWSEWTEWNENTWSEWTKQNGWNEWNDWNDWNEWNDKRWNDWNEQNKWSEWNDWSEWSEWNEWDEWTEQTWNEWSEWSEWNDWNDWNEWNEWNDKRWSDSVRVFYIKQFSEAAYKLKSLKSLKLFADDGMFIFHPQISASKEWTENLANSTSNLIIEK